MTNINLPYCEACKKFTTRMDYHQKGAEHRENCLKVLNQFHEAGKITKNELEHGIKLLSL